MNGHELLLPWKRNRAKVPAPCRSHRPSIPVPDGPAAAKLPALMDSEREGQALTKAAKSGDPGSGCGPVFARIRASPFCAQRFPGSQRVPPVTAPPTQPEPGEDQRLVSAYRLHSPQASACSEPVSKVFGACRPHSRPPRPKCLTAFEIVRLMYETCRILSVQNGGNVWESELAGVISTKPFAPDIPSILLLNGSSRVFRFSRNRAPAARGAANTSDAGGSEIALSSKRRGFYGRLVPDSIVRLRRASEVLASVEHEATER